MLKKILLLLCTTCLVAMVCVGCGGADNSVEKKENQTSKESETNIKETEKVSSDISEVTSENFTNFPVTPESEFEIDYIENGVLIRGCNSDDAVIVVPKSIDGKDVVEIGDGAFFEKKMTAVVLPNSVTYIGTGAFQGCENLQFFNTGKGLKSINSMALANCNKLESISFPQGMVDFYGVVFYSCESLNEVYVPASVTNIPMGILDVATCPNAVIITPSGSDVEKDCIEYGIPYRN